MIDFDIAPHINEDKVKKHFEEALKYIKDKFIDYIEILQEDEGYIYVNKNGEDYNKWNETTFQICILLNTLGFEAYLAEEDYGYIDVIVLHKW